TRQKMRDLVNKVGLSEVDIFESSWAVKCLFCEDAKECQHPKRADNIDYVIKQIDDDLERVREHPSYDELREEAKLVIERVRVEGSTQASVMYFFGKK
ncbi:MAG: hypothetical protein KAU48_13925, partial [Candidatus Thorarchaeota archaeon]|nr:hypothetical protein [Candidatus Thorarchaeota archaeon]